MLLGKKKAGVPGLGFVLFLVIGMLFSPSPLLGGEYTTYDCTNDVITSYESAGQQISALIPAGAKVFWTGYSPVTLLYLPQAQIYPAQLHGTYSFRIAEDSDALLRYGWMNQSLAEQWLEESDFVVSSARSLDRSDWLTTGLGEKYTLILETAPLSCQPDSEIMVFRRK